MKARAALFCGLALAGCGPGNSALAPYAGARLEAGVGLGDLRLGETTLGGFVQRFGRGRTDLVAGDEIGYELVFENGELSFLFVIDPECWRALPDGALRRGQKDLEALMREAPCVREQTLSSLSVALKRGGSTPFFQGATEKGARIGGPQMAAFAHGIPRESRPDAMLAGETGSGRGERLHFPDGISFVYEAEGGGDPLQAPIRRIVIYVPDR